MLRIIYQLIIYLSSDVITDVGMVRFITFPCNILLVRVSKIFFVDFVVLILSFILQDFMDHYSSLIYYLVNIICYLFSWYFF